MAQPYVLNASVTAPAVSVSPAGAGEQVVISWAPQPSSSGYRVYAGFDPVSVRSLVSGINLLPNTQTSFTFTPPLTPPTQIVYFWVTTNLNGTDIFLADRGSYLLSTYGPNAFVPNPHSQMTEDVYMLGTDQQYFFEEIRRRAQAISEDTCEPVDVYIRQWNGLPDPTSQDQLGTDPNYQSMTRDSNTFGTGFFPGFFPAVNIRMRFGALPNSLLDFQIPGLRPLLVNEAWTLWEPLLHENDLIVRRSTGQRYVISEVAPSNYRGDSIVERISLKLVSPSSPLQTVTDALVRQRWGLVNASDYSRVGFGVAPDGAGAPNLLIF